jgi:hypothetical protein
MNRHKRRRAKALKVGSVVNIHWGRCLMAGEAEVTCFACGGEAKDWPWLGGPALLGYGLAEIHSGEATMQVPICEACFSSPDGNDAVARKVFGAPDMQITDGGYASPEEVAALAEKQSAVEH